jgi:hypothetical protein
MAGSHLLFFTGPKHVNSFSKTSLPSGYILPTAATDTVRHSVRLTSLFTMSTGVLDTKYGPSRFEGTYRLHLQDGKGPQENGGLFGLLFSPEDRGGMFLRNVGFSPKYPPLQSTRPYSS